MTKVFISYAREDSVSATRLYRELGAVSGIIPWLDTECLLPGIRWRPAIRKEIRESDFFLALLSTKSVSRRGFVHHEMNEALEIMKEFPDNRIYLIPIRLDDCELPFDELADIHYVDFFPDWNKGLEKVLTVVNANRPLEVAKAKQETTISGPEYHYRVGIVDLDIGLVNLPQMAQRLNTIQNFFHFTYPSLPPVKNEVRIIGGFPNLAIHEIPTSFYEEHQYLNVDLVACLTKYPLAFQEEGRLLYNYFSGPSDIDERFMFISTHLLYEFTKQAGCSFEKGIVYIILSQLVVYFTDLGFHTPTLGCVMDFCEYRPDIVEGLRKMSFCSHCYSQIQNTDFGKALEAILNSKF